MKFEQETTSTTKVRFHIVPNGTDYATAGDAAAKEIVTLPAIASVPEGWYVKIVVGTNCTSNDYIITENTTYDTDIIVSQINELETDTNTDGPSNTGHTTITLPNATDTVGDTFDIWSNGTNYFVQGTTKLDAGAVLA